MLKNRTKVSIIILACAAFAVIAGYLLIGNPAAADNNQKLERAVKSVNSETVQLNEVIPFEWDAVYTFAPYMGKEEIEEVVGFKSADIKENNISEGMVHLLFTKDKKVVASILGYSEHLGYRIDFTSKVTFAEDARFNVTKADGVTTLAYAR